MRHHDDHDCGTTEGDTMTKTTTNGHDHGGTDGTVRWLAAHELSDLPAHLSGGLVASQGPDETPIWGSEMPDPDALAAAVERAQRAVALQGVDELMQAKSPADIAKDLEAEREVRDLDRKRRLNRRKAEIEEAEAEDQHQARLARLTRAAKEEAAEARQEAEKIANPWHEVVRTWRARKWWPLAATVPALFSLIAGAVNVGVELTRIFPDHPLISWMVDPILSILIVVLGATHLYGSAQSRRSREFLAIEAALFLLTGTAAVGLHFIDGPTPESAGAQWGDVGPWIWLIVPIGLGASMWAVPKVRAKLSDDLVQASAEAERSSSGTNFDHVRPTPSDLHGTNRDEGVGTNLGANLGTNSGASSSQFVPDPERESLDSIRARLRALVEEGQIDPKTVSVNAAREALGVRRERAEEALIAEYGRPDLVARRERRKRR